MDEQMQIVQTGGRRRSRAEAEQLVAEYNASGLSQADFCRSRGVSLATLARYRKRLRDSGGGAVSSSRWVAVELPGAGSGSSGASSSGLTIALAAGRRIEVGRGFDARTLVELLGVLERF
jgi:transposase-like protein